MKRLKKVLSVTNALAGRKIFCLSTQKTGTSSIDVFFRTVGMRIAGYDIARRNEWDKSWLIGDYKAIFRSFDFQTCQVFEDDPWWYGDFYKYVFNEFPRATFILFERDPDSWFNSMLAHSAGMTLGNTQLHASIFHRQPELEGLREAAVRYDMMHDNLLPLTEDHRNFYCRQYVARNAEIRRFFSIFGKNRLFFAQLEDEMKWEKLASFFGIYFHESLRIHANKTVSKKPVA